MRISNNLKKIHHIHGNTLLICLLAFPFSLKASEVKYPVNQIPGQLKTNAKSVIRYEETIVEIKSISEANIYHRVVLTILNENSLGKAIFAEFYDKFQRIHDIRGALYNAEGEKTEQLTQDKIIDHSAISYYSVYEDNRIKYFEPRYRTVPFTVEYSYETKLDGILAFPSWMPVHDYNTSVQKSVFKIIAPDNTYFKYFGRNTLVQPVIETKPDMITCTWTLENQPAFEEEPFSASFPGDLPAIYFAPNNFSIANYSGNMSSWLEFGKWSWEINKDRDQLPEATKEIIKELIQDCTSDLEKAQKIYAFFQKKTRYVSIQIGIGGWQPMEASTVDKLGYGDCKALVNYLRALLSVAGIESYYTLVLAGENAVQPIHEFPSQQFNHVILCLPVNGDTIWLECTNQQIPFGYIGMFTDDRTVLVINQQGGKLTRTRKYNDEENTRNSHILISIDESGNALVNRKAVYSGLFFDKNFQLPLVEAERQKKLIYNKINIPGIVLNSYQYGVKAGFVPSLEESIQFYAPRYSSTTGERILVKFNTMDNQYDIPGHLTERKFNIYIRRDYCTIDTLTIQFPDGFMIESLPANAVITSFFGQCEYTFVRTGNNIVDYIRKVRLKSGVSSPKAYNDLLDFYAKMISADNLKMCLKKKTA